MVNYDNMPLFPLQVVLYPDMPLPLHIFEPRYRKMIRQCHESNQVFGVILDPSCSEADSALPGMIGTTARLTQLEELADGRMNIEVLGETRFKVLKAKHQKPYMTAQVEPLWEQAADLSLLMPDFEAVIRLFKTYLRSLFARLNRPLSTVQLPREPEYLSYAIASVLQIPLEDKQALLEMTNTQKRLKREIEILDEEITAQTYLARVGVSAESRVSTRPKIVRADIDALRKLSSLN